MPRPSSMNTSTVVAVAIITSGVTILTQLVLSNMKLQAALNLTKNDDALAFLAGYTTPSTQASIMALDPNSPEAILSNTMSGEYAAQIIEAYRNDPRSLNNPSPWSNS